MEDKNHQLQKEIDRLKRENRELILENLQLKKSIELHRDLDYIEKAAKLKAIEYIVRSSDYSIHRESLMEILDIPVQKQQKENF